MKDFITDILKASSADGWTVSDQENEGWEFYFIRHRLDQNRVRHTEHITLTVYKRLEDGKYLGSASAKLSPAADREEARALVDSLLKEAELVKNPYYELAPPADAAAEADTEADVMEIAGDFIRTLKNLPETGGEDINSYEIFADRIRSRFLSSTGIDIRYNRTLSKAEVVVNARNEGHEIELYRMYSSGSCDSRGLAEEISRTMQYGRDKLHAQKTPYLGCCDVILSTDAALEVYRYFIDRMSAGLKYQGISDWEIGGEVIKGAEGDKVTLEAVRILPNSSENAPYDSEGAPRRDLMILKDGIAVNYFGSRQFSSYLGLEDSFIPGNFAVSGGKKTAAEIRSGRYLEVVEFSDFQVSAFNGDIFGEIRLGYLHDGDRVTVLEGGSVSGTMREFAKNLLMSKERKQYDNMLIPEITRLADVSITGAE
ncbi:MAG: TldD/PmbA family protein [Lachnospiraceae bacterium]|nr:TldD/PmbA family protein [Lachnospiraceae bacterium]